MTILVVGDTHLTESPADEYRWDFFRLVRMAAQDNGVSAIHHLGDLIDRKDRFPATFVNRLIEELRLTASIAPLDVLRGNHDTPLNGPAFFQFVNETLDGVRYITQPTLTGARHDLWLLPFDPKPEVSWAPIDFSEVRAAFMHQTVTGALTENGFTIEHGTRLPVLPRELMIYSGDVHVQQECRNICYVGCPHPVKFGDDYPCRLLILDDNYEIVKEIKLDPQRKRVIRVNSLEELRLVTIRPGDQAKVEMTLTVKDVDRYSELEQGLVDWSKATGVVLSSHEFTIHEQSTGTELNLDLAPSALLREFATDEGISDDLLSVGLELLEKVRK